MRERGATLSTQGVYKRARGGGGEKRERKSEKLITLGASQPAVQEKRVNKKTWRRSSIDLEESSKHLRFRSLQIHHIIQRGTIFQTTALLDRPLDHQLVKSSLTKPGITQQRPNRSKKAFHKALATPQWRRRWSTDSPSDSQSQHLFTTTKPLLLRLSTVRIFPNAAVQAKNATLGGALDRQMLFQGKMEDPEGERAR
jgi:hypothetical protein